ncbi:MAG TPA: ATP-binding protein [Pseudonocardia sp.]|jgi:anti-sigma regulatory factor (Ser/Thr protein kinase)|nr:ATP-binding protein [Pseudonocardia sp.]
MSTVRWVIEVRGQRCTRTLSGAMIPIDAWPSCPGGPAGGPDHRPVPPVDPSTGPGLPAPLRLQIPVDPVAVSVVRDRLRAWLAAQAWPTGQSQDIVLAVNEAVSNAVEHAYLDHPSGVVELHAAATVTRGGQRRVTVVVDDGRWRPPPADDENRRRGIPLMHACMDTVTITAATPGGTRVTLRSHPVPPPTLLE